MSRRKTRLHMPGWLGGLACGLLAALGLVGCVGPEIRSQSGEEIDYEKYDVKTIGDVSTFGNAEPVPVGGVGLVTGLDGTGSNPPLGDYRTMLERELDHAGVRKIKEVLADPSNSLVLVSGMIQPGAHKGDLIDVEVTLPPESKTTSLRGGHLQACRLFNYEYVRNLDPSAAQSNRALPGHPLVKAEGTLLVGFGDGDEAAKDRQGRIWGGGRCAQDQAFYIILNNDQQYSRVAAAVADRINETFHGSFRGSLNNEIAKAENKAVVLLTVPPQYKLNLPHYLRVVRLVPLHDEPTSPHGDKPAANGKKPSAAEVRSNYRRRLEEDLLNPSRTVTAALRLEALGAGSIPALKAGLQSKHPLVRFCSAESLAYLDCPSAGQTLAEMVEQHPVLRAFSLTAMASMDQAICHVKLRELLSSERPETRYGAFRALRSLDEHDAAIQGDLLGDSFWVHQVAPNSPPLIHISSNRRAEIVLFGEEAVLKPPFSFLAGEFTITAGNDDEHCTISRFQVHRGTRTPPRQCSLKVVDVLHTLASLGGQYPEAVELLRQANSCQCVTCRVEVDQLPQATSVYDLARSAKGDPELLRMDAEILDAKPDFGATPTLYEKDSARRPRSETEADEEAALRDRQARK
jgi:hypothetical protein